MSLSAAIIDALMEAGATREQIAAAIKADIAEREAEAKAKLESKRAGNRKRQQAKRDRERNTESRVTGVTERDTPALEVSQTLPRPTPTPPLIPPSPKRGTRLADDFDPPEDWIAWAMKKRGWSRQDALDECECFARYWQAKPGRQACKLDWTKTWQNWVVNSNRRTQSHSPPGSSYLDHLIEQKRALHQ